MSAGRASVPQLRFPGFEGAWKRQRLGKFIEEYREKSIEPDQHEVLTSARSGLVPQVEYYGEGRIVDRDNVGFNVIPPNYLTYRSRSDDRRFFFNENTTGKTGIISVYYPVFRIKDGSNKFFTELLEVKQHYIGKFSVGTSQTVLSLNELKRILLPVPTALEQQKIAAFLDTVSRKIALLEEKKAALTEYKRGLMQRLFSGELRFTRDDGSAFPDWEERRLENLFDWVRTNSLSRDFLTDSSASGIQNIHYGDIHVKFRALFRQSQENAPFLLSTAPIHKLKNAEFLRVGDVVIADASEDYADIGKAIEIIEVIPESLVAGLHTLVARPKDSLLVPGFTGYLLRTEKVRKQIMKIAQGISVLGVSKSNLETLRFFLPHPDEQRKIAGVLSALDAKIDALSRKISETAAFRKGLLQQLFV